MIRNPEDWLNGAITKRRKTQNLQLCNLPMDILSRILSELPINDAIRTSILSREWKYIWCGHNNLTFDSATMRKHYFKSTTGYGYGILRDNEFVARVDKVLDQHSGAGVERMTVKFKLHNKHANYIDRWINFAIASKTKELIIELSGWSKLLLSRDLLYGIERVGEEPYNLPAQLFSAGNGSYLKCLELTSVSLQLPADFIGLQNLKNLTLVDVNITDEDVQRMLSKCTRMEFVEIAYCRMVTSIHTPCPLGQLKHLIVDKCPLLKEIELKCSLATLQYTGTVVPMVFGSTYRLTNICIKFLTYHAALDYIISGFPSTLPSLETMTLLCTEHERTNLPIRHCKYDYLRYLKLELVIFDYEDREIDALDYAQVLEVAPFIEKLELHMWMNCRHQPYCKEDGELRSPPSRQHAHLMFVCISGFFGHKDQVELALHILRSSVNLEKMKITPMIEVSGCDSATQGYRKAAYADGYRIATEFICKEDQLNIVEAVKASFPWDPYLSRVMEEEVEHEGEGPLDIVVSTLDG